MFIVYTLQKYSVHFQDQNGEVLTQLNSSSCVEMLNYN